MYEFTVKPDGAESYEVTATTRDVLRWEKSGQSKGKPTRNMQSMVDEPAIADLYEIAFYAAKRTGHFEGSLVDFENNVDLDIDREQVASDPTPSAASADDS